MENDTDGYFYTVPAPRRPSESPRNFSVTSELTMTEMEDEQDIDFPNSQSGGSVMEYSDTSDDQSNRKSFRSNFGSSSDRTEFDIRADEEGGRWQQRRRTPSPPPPPQQEKESKTKSLGQRWFASLAYSFRSPAPHTHKRPTPLHERSPSRGTQEYPHHALTPFEEESPLLGSSNTHTTYDRPGSYPATKLPILEDQAERRRFTSRASNFGDRKESYNRSTRLAASFLKDYQANRPATLEADLGNITERKRAAAVWINHPLMKILRFLACFGLFLSSAFEGFSETTFRARYRPSLAALNVIALIILLTDVYLNHLIQPAQGHPSQQHLRVRSRRTLHFVRPMLIFGITLILETLARLLVTEGRIVLFASVFKPLVLFYVSQRARDAAQALIRIFRIVMRVIVMEMLLILMFAAVACRLFGHDPSFNDLSSSWLSLFKLSTTVVNPSIWMPLYEENRWSAVFFIFFVTSSVFYLHSLVLSVVFSTYVQAATEIHERSSADRETAVQLAFISLLREQETEDWQRRSSLSSRRPIPRGAVHITLIRDTLRVVRSHYNAMKINALVEIVDPSNQGYVDYPSFRTKIRQALNASVRTARSATPLAMSVELIAVAVAVVNFGYVILVSSDFDAMWLNATQHIIGSFITLVAGFELLVRFNPLNIPNFTPLTRLNATFDGLALVAAIVSLIGMFSYMAGVGKALDYILMGRAIDMIRVMRFFPIFRDVVRRSSDVIPVLAGPLVLVGTTLHVFVYCGMALWGGMVDVGLHKDAITPLYDLNNFNSYIEGVVTMFQVLVVNDWHAIAEVFLYAERCSDPRIVYPFFVVGNLLGVSIMLNVLTAFFVETFVTKLDDDTERADTTTKQRERDFSIQTSENSSVRRISSQTSLLYMDQFSTRTGSSRNHKIAARDDDHGADADSEASSESEVYEFDVYEREGFDKIMQTVAGGSNSAEYARQICGFFEVFEGMTPGRETVGYLICDQQTLERYGNRRFQAKAIGFLEENELHAVVSEINSQLLALSSRPSFDLDRALSRRFPHRTLQEGPHLEVSASLLRRHPALSLFITRIKENDQAT